MIVNFWKNNFIEAACWELFRRKLNRTCGGEEDASQRAVFDDRVRKNKEHNQLYDIGIVTYTKVVNQFADSTEEELNKMDMYFNRM